MAADKHTSSKGLQALIRKYHTKFHRPENTNYYSEEAYREAERKFIRFCLLGKQK